MDSIQVGWLSLLPPIIAIVLALMTKEVISSLLIGIFSGTLIYTIFTTPNDIVAGTVSNTFVLMADKFGSNALIIVFLALLGVLVAVVTKAGGSRAYGEWASSKIKTRTGASLATSALGALIFIDDYFNCLTVGTVMRPVTDKHGISRAKLAYIIDATAAPVCIIAPVSSWAAAIISQLSDNGLNGMEVFMSTIPMNLYAILTLIMIVVLSIWNLDFGPMGRHERNIQKNGEVNSANEGKSAPQEDFSDMEISSRGKVLDLIIPIAALIVFTVLFMLYIGGLFDGSGKSIAEAFGDTDASLACSLGGFCAIFVAFILYLPRKIISFREFMSCVTEGIKSMVPAFIILTLAWTISGVCRDLLETGSYVASLVEESNFPVAFLPALIFIVAGLLSFATGTSWGTFGILIPVVVDMCAAVAPELLVVTLAATFAGSVFGDHCSPISDTTILSSTGAGCDHLVHVSTQMGYAVTVALCCFAGYLVSGFMGGSVLIPLLVSIASLVATLIAMRIKQKNS